MKNWYIVTTYSGLENSVKVDIERRRISMNMEDKIHNVLIPEETVEVTDKKGNKKEKIIRLFPGYVFVQVETELKEKDGRQVQEIADDVWFIVRNTPKVTGILGSSGGGTKPVPVPDDEMNRILKASGITVKQSEYNVGDEILVISGPFEGNTYKIESVNEDKKIVEVSTDLMGMSISTELSMNEIKKISNEEEKGEDE